MKHKAFTLIELLVVIVIIGILATLTTATFNNSLEKARNAKMLVELEALYDELERHAIVNQDDPNVLFYGNFSGNSSSNYNFVPTNVMSIWEDAGFDMGTSYGYSGMTNLMRRYIDPNTIVIVFGSGGNSSTSASDNDFAMVGWGNGFGSFDPSQPGIIVVGTPRMRQALEESASIFVKEDFQNTNFLKTQQFLFRYLCRPTSVYTFYLRGAAYSTSGLVATGNEDRNSSFYTGGGFTDNPVCPY